MPWPLGSISYVNHTKCVFCLVREIQLIILHFSWAVGLRRSKSKSDQRFIRGRSHTLHFLGLSFRVFHFFSIFEIENAWGLIWWGYGHNEKIQNYF